MNLQTLNRKILYPNQGMGLTPFAYKKGGKVCYADGGEVEDDDRMTPMPERKGLSLAAMQPKEAGMIVGPGTGTSDSIPADLQEGSFILPANVVAYFGRDFIDALVGAQGPAEDEGGMVPAKVSNGEYHVPPEAVERIGEKALRAMIAAVQGNEQKSAEMDGQGRVKLAVGDDPEEQYRKALAAQNNGGQQGASQVANTDLSLKPKSGLDTFVSGVRQGAASQTTNTNPVTPAPGVNVQGQSRSLADQAKVQTQTQPAQTAPELEKPKSNILGEPVQTLDSFGGYQVRGADGSTAREIPFSASDDSALRRTLPADQYQNLQQQKRSFADQLANSVVAQSSSFEKNGRGYSSSSARGDFKPTLADFSRGDNTTALALEKLRQDQNQFQLNYDQKQKELGKNVYDTTTDAVGNQVTYPKSGPAADEAYAEQQKISIRTKRAQNILNDPAADKEKKLLARQFLDSLGR